jgi:protein phosphatase
MRGKNNEDRYGVSAYHSNHGERTPSVLAVVADGIGGHQAGEVAAELAVNEISQIVAESNAQRPTEILKNSFVHAGNVIRNAAQKNPVYHRMGTTCAAAWVVGDKLYTATVGDSRIYLIRRGLIQQLSTDHTWIQEAIDNGALDRDQARTHPNAHVIRRYLGSSKQVVPDLRLRYWDDGRNTSAEGNQGVSLQPGDNLLLCTDGLTDLVEDSEILQVLSNNPSQEAMDLLVNLANQRGGHDNITLVVVKVPWPQPKTVPRSNKNWKRYAPVSLFVLGGLVLFVLIFSGSLYRYFTRAALDNRLDTSVTPLVQPVLFPTANPQVEVIAPVSSPLDFSKATEESVNDQIASGISEKNSALDKTLTPWPTNTQIHLP